MKLVPYRSPRIMIDIAGSKLYSIIIPDAIKMPNFTTDLENLNVTYVDLVSASRLREYSRN